MNTKRLLESNCIRQTSLSELVTLSSEQGSGFGCARATDKCPKKWILRSNAYFWRHIFLFHSIWLKIITTCDRIIVYNVVLLVNSSQERQGFQNPDWNFTYGNSNNFPVTSHKMCLIKTQVRKNSGILEFGVFVCCGFFCLFVSWKEVFFHKTHMCMWVREVLIKITGRFSLIHTSCANILSLALWYSSSRSSMDLLLLSSFNRILI